MSPNTHGPNIDKEKGIAQFGGNEDLYISILGYYVEDMQPLLNQVKSVSEDSLEAYAQAAHAIKGASRNVFATDLGNTAEKLEHAAKEGDYAYVAQHQETLFEEAQTLIQDIKDMMAERGL